uniref:SET domain-containing protein n=1 Tax=Mycena chlorophos TaxID=658473 RepID=A0ABQ0KU01_MYCCL|nr:predicted protein [Mycena chlorophos]
MLCLDSVFERALRDICGDLLAPRGIDVAGILWCLRCFSLIQAPGSSVKLGSVRFGGVKGLCLRASKPIPSGTILHELVGLLSCDEFNPNSCTELSVMYDEEHVRRTLDGPLRLVNHHCESANVELDETRRGVVLRAIEDIAEDSEILVDYGDDYFDGEEDCWCSSCRPELAADTTSGGTTPAALVTKYNTITPFIFRPPPSMDALPVELLCMVIEKLGDDQSTLAKLARVSKIWKELSHAILWRDLDGDNEVHLLKLLELEPDERRIAQMQAVSGEDMNGLTEEAFVPTRHVLSYVRKVVASGFLLRLARHIPDGYLNHEDIRLYMVPGLPVPSPLLSPRLKRATIIYSEDPPHRSDIIDLASQLLPHVDIELDIGRGVVVQEVTALCLAPLRPMLTRARLFRQGCEAILDLSQYEKLATLDMVDFTDAHVPAVADETPRFQALQSVSLSGVPIGAVEGLHRLISTAPLQRYSLLLAQGAQPKPLLPLELRTERLQQLVWIDGSTIAREEFVCLRRYGALQELRLGATGDLSWLDDGSLREVVPQLEHLRVLDIIHLAADTPARFGLKFLKDVAEMAPRLTTIGLPFNTEDIDMSGSVAVSGLEELRVGCSPEPRDVTTLAAVLCKTFPCLGRVWCNGDADAFLEWGHVDDAVRLFRLLASGGAEDDFGWMSAAGVGWHRMEVMRRWNVEDRRSALSSLAPNEGAAGRVWPLLCHGSANRRFHAARDMISFEDRPMPGVSMRFGGEFPLSWEDIQSPDVDVESALRAAGIDDWQAVMLALGAAHVRRGLGTII